MSMALDIETKTAYGRKWQSLRVGSHPATHDGIDVREVVSVSADGDELEKIRREITGIPMSTKRVVTWFGDDARFIVANLNY